MRAVLPTYLVSVSLLAILLSSAYSLPLSSFFEITDESYYVLHGLYPKDFVGFTIFGFLNSFFLSYPDVGIVEMRMIGVAILATAGFILGSLFGALFLKTKNRAERISYIFLCSVCGMAATLGFYKHTLFFPSYNMYNIVGIALALSAICATFSKNFFYRTFAHFCLGFMAPFLFTIKGTTGAFYIFVSILIVILSYKNNIILLQRLGAYGFGLFAGALLFHFFVIDIPSIAQAIYHDLWEAPPLIGKGFGIVEKSVEFFVVYLWRHQSFILLFSAIVMAVSFRLFGSGENAQRGARVPETYVLTAVLAIALLIGFLNYTVASCRWLAAVPTAAILLPVGLTYLFLVRENLGLRRLVTSAGVLDRDDRALLVKWIVLLAWILPLTYVYGTNNSGYLRHSISASLLSFLPLVILFLNLENGPRYGFLRLLPAIMLVVMASVRLEFAGQCPYRAAPAGEQTITVEGLLGKGGPIKVDPPTAAYIEALRQDAGRAGFLPGTPFIDMTGASPGAAVVLAAKPLGRVWFPGGYDGSDQWARHYLGRAPNHQLNRAWVLTSKEGRLALDAQTILGDLGLPFPEGYEAVGQYTWPQRDNEKQTLWRPLRSIDD